MHGYDRKSVEHAPVVDVEPLRRDGEEEGGKTPYVSIHGLMHALMYSTTHNIRYNAPRRQNIVSLDLCATTHTAHMLTAHPEDSVNTGWSLTCSDTAPRRPTKEEEDEEEEEEEEDDDEEDDEDEEEEEEVEQRRPSPSPESRAAT